MPTSDTGRRVSWPVLVGVGCLTAALLIVELALTRVFSVTMFHHFAFLAISIAMFGLSASAVFVYVTPRLHPPEHPLGQLVRYATLFWVLALLAAILLLRINVGTEYSVRNLAWMLVLYLLAALPFAAGGAAVTIAVSRLHGDIGRVYAADLVGAAAGCLLLIPALNMLGGGGAILFAAWLGTWAAWCFRDSARRSRAVSWVPVAVLAVALVWQASSPWLDVHATKGWTRRNVVFSKWNSFSRIAVHNQPHHDWGLSEAYTGPRSGSLYMDIDGAASTPILDGRSGVRGVEYLKWELTGLAYAIKPRAHALIIGPGGGRDIWTALVYGATRVEGVEVNPIIVDDVMMNRYRAYSGNIYQLPGVTVAVDDGRSYVRRSADRFDVIQASLVDTWAATTAGAFTLTENNLYTVEAFDDYLRHLKPDGILSVSRWYDDGLRLVTLAWEAGRRLGWTRLSDRLFVVRHGTLATFILKRSPFTPAEVSTLTDTASRLRFEVTYAPAATPDAPVPDNPYARFAVSTDPDAFIRDFPSDIGASTDDRPFFFYAREPLARSFSIVFDRTLLFGKGSDAIRTLLFLSVVLVVIFIVVPLIWLSPEPVGGVRTGVVPVAYFACLGAGFMMIEIGFLQRFVLFLGHPVYSLSVILFSLLLGGGIGSAISRRFGASPGRALAAAIPAIVLAGLAYSFLLPVAFDSWIGLARPLRVALAVALLLPMGILLGVPLPSGIRILGQQRPGLLAWAWGVNGAMSVLGASMAIFIAMNWGFSAVAFVGAAVYAVAGLLAIFMARRPAS